MAARNFIDPFSCVIYDGMSSPKEWIRSFNILAVYQDWDNEKKLANIPLFLKGKAQRVYDGMAMKTEIKQVTDELLAKCAVTSDALIVQFYNRKKKQDESYAQFASSLQDILSNALPDLDASKQLPLLRAQLCAGVPDNIKTLVNFNRSLKWDELVVCLEQAFPTSSDAAASYAQNLIDTVKTEPIESNYTSSRSSASSSRPTRARFQGNCHFCQAFGHRQAECMKLRQGNRMDGHSTQNSFNSSFRSAYSQPNQVSDRTRLGPGNRGQVKPRNVDQYNSFAGSSAGSGYRPNVTFQQPEYQGQAYANELTSELQSQRRRENLGGGGQSSFRNLSPGPPQFNANVYPENGSFAPEELDSNFIMVDSTKQRYLEFPYMHSESFTAEITQATVNTGSTLLRLPVEFGFNEDPKITVRALIDGGSTHSFLSQRTLSGTQLSMLANNTDCHKVFLIKGATGVVKDHCFLIKASISIGDWQGIQEFVVSKAVSRNDMVLGRDFLRANTATVDHGNDALILKGKAIKVFTDSCQQGPSATSNNAVRTNTFDPPADHNH